MSKSARLVRRISQQEFVPSNAREAPVLAIVQYRSGTFPPAKLAFTVRVFDRKGRASEFSAPVAVDIARRDAGVDQRASKGVS
jgi:hypothetical protein